MMDTSRIDKLFHLALHPGTPEHEAYTACCLAVKLCRKNNVTSLSVGRTKTKRQSSPEWTPPEPEKPVDEMKDPIMTFGKYKGVRVSKIAENDRQYARWFIQNIKNNKMSDAFAYWY